MPRGDSNLPVAPVLVPLHPVAVVERDWAAVRDGVEAELPGVKRLPGADVFSPAKGEELQKPIRRWNDASPAKTI